MDGFDVNQQCTVTEVVSLLAAGCSHKVLVNPLMLTSSSRQCTEMGHTLRCPQSQVLPAGRSYGWSAHRREQAELLVIGIQHIELGLRLIRQIHHDDADGQRAQHGAST